MNKELKILKIKANMENLRKLLEKDKESLVSIKNRVKIYKSRIKENKKELKKLK